ncbi:hypothetical protein AGMMS49944_16330 [Spirochaetia bacterium]|nr:hypothetical protein AGMMS49944_16330 [Spirochaetia bacterium]
MVKYDAEVGRRLVSYEKEIMAEKDYDAMITSPDGEGIFFNDSLIGSWQDKDDSLPFDINGAQTAFICLIENAYRSMIKMKMARCEYCGSLGPWPEYIKYGTQEKIGGICSHCGKHSTFRAIYFYPNGLVERRPEIRHIKIEGSINLPVMPGSDRKDARG